MPFRAKRAAQAVVQPPDAATYTRMKNPTEPFRLPIPGWQDKLKGKAVLVSIMGSWCPNCHEEMPLLLELYNRYRGQGFEIISLGFEYTGEKERDERMLRLFVDKYKVPWPVLYAGSTEDAPTILGQLENFGAYPTSIYIGRDGLVKAVHAGFDGPSTGARHEQLKQHIREQVNKLVNAHERAVQLRNLRLAR
jgi:thiol-disulfide isomerase/thioredoxin